MRTNSTPAADATRSPLPREFDFEGLLTLSERVFSGRATFEHATVEERLPHPAAPHTAQASESATTEASWQGLRRRLDDYERELTDARSRIEALQSDSNRRLGREAELRQGLESRLHAAESRAIEAESREQKLKLMVAVLKNTCDDDPDAKFKNAKRSFARLFHPDCQGATASPERTAFFAEFWAVLESIDRAR